MKDVLLFFPPSNKHLRLYVVIIIDSTYWDILKQYILNTWYSLETRVVRSPSSSELLVSRDFWDVRVLGLGFLTPLQSSLLWWVNKQPISITRENVTQLRMYWIPMKYKQTVTTCTLKLWGVDTVPYCRPAPCPSWKSLPGSLDLGYQRSYWDEVVFGESWFSTSG